MANNVIPYGQVDSDYEKAIVWFNYGQKAVRDGFRLEKGEGNKPAVLGEVSYPICRKQEPDRKEWMLYCGPFRMDWYTSPIHFAFREEDTSQLPPR